MRSHASLTGLLSAFSIFTTAALPALAMPPIQSTSVVQSNNVTGFKLMREAVKAKGGFENSLVSPISAHFALSIALNGASGKTSSDFIKALGYDYATVSGINSENKALLANISVQPLSEAQKQKLIESGQGLPPVVSINNSLWATNGKTSGRPYQFEANFVKAVKDAYGIAKPVSLDFKAKASADVINKWTDEKTFGMIPTIIEPSALKDLIWAIVNTTYVEGQWQKAFGEPFKDDFTKADGKKMKADMMFQKGRMRYHDSGDFEIVELAMKNSTLKTFLVLTKDANDFEKVQTSADGIWSLDRWSEMISKLSMQNGKLTVPKFSFEYGVEMKQDLPVTKAMGLNFLFQDSADFSKMDGPNSEPSKIGMIKQNTKIEFDRYGVKAAAATLVGGVSRSAMPVRGFDMNIDRPFFFAIYDEKTQAFLFLGQVVEPK